MEERRSRSCCSMIMEDEKWEKDYEEFCDKKDFEIKIEFNRKPVLVTKYSSKVIQVSLLHQY